MLTDLRAQAIEVGARSVDIDNLPTIEIEGIVKQYQEILKTLDRTKSEVLEFTSLLQAQSESKASYEAWDSSPKTIENTSLLLSKEQSKNKASYEVWDSDEAIANVQQKPELEFNSSKDVHNLPPKILMPKECKI